MAKASGMELSARELDRIAEPLETLETTFRPLVASLTPDMEPDVHLQPEETE
jgi:hypothetical protein